VIHSHRFFWVFDRPGVRQQLSWVESEKWSYCPTDRQVTPPSPKVADAEFMCEAMKGGQRIAMIRLKFDYPRAEASPSPLD
jgi:hypothetical protein